MPWYWTDDLARLLIDAGKVAERAVANWLSAPVAIRSEQEDSLAVAASLLPDDGEDGEPPSLALAA